MPDPKLQSIVEKMVAAGEPEENIALVIQHYQPAPAAQPEGRSLGGFLGNVASSGAKMVSDTVQGIPALAGAAAKLVRAGVDPDYRTQMAMQMGQAAPAVLSAVGQAAKNRYGGIEQIKNTLYTDPVGALGDVATLADGIGLASKVGGATKLARLAEGVGAATNPVNLAGKVVEPVTSGVANAVVRGTLRAPAAVREDFGGSKAIADAVLKDRVYSSASAGKKLNQSVATADQMLADAQAAGTPGVSRVAVARSVLGGPQDTAKLRTRLGVPDQTPDLTDTAKAIFKNNPSDIPLTDAQSMKREAQSLAYEAGTDNQTVKKAAEIAKAKALRAGIENSVPDVGPVNEKSQRLLGSKLAFDAAEDRPRALTNFLSVLGGVGGFAGGGPGGAALAPLLIKAMDSPRAGAMAGIGIDSIGRALAAQPTYQGALLARLLGQ